MIKGIYETCSPAFASKWRSKNGSETIMDDPGSDRLAVGTCAPRSVFFFLFSSETCATKSADCVHL